MNNMIVFTGGGTGGHIFPGLAVIDELKNRTDANIAWIGASKGIDRELVEGHGIAFYGIPSGKLRRYFDFHNFTDFFRIIAGFFSALALLLKLKPKIVFSKGGFVSVPPCMAARLLRIPLVTHECDFSPGLATRINARFATDIYVSCKDTVALFPEKFRKRITVTGNPVRPAFYSGDPTRGRAFIGASESKLPILLVLGGSLGARQVNDLIAGCVDRLCSRFIVVHQTGSQNTDQTISPENGLTRERYKPFPFIRSEMPDVLASATVVVARSGANTVWECAAAGKPMILVPLEKGSSRGDQVENARFFVGAGAATMMTGLDATSDRLARTAIDLIDNERLFSDMASASLAMGTSRPARLIADLMLEKTGSRSGAGK